MNSSKLLADFNYTFKYAKYLPKLYRRETWEEAVDRVMDMHWNRIKDRFGSHCYDYSTWTDDVEENFYKEFQAAKQAYLNKEVLGSQRTLQFGGEGVLKHEMRSYNCLARETRFITDVGPKSFEDFEHGDEIKVLTHTGQFKPATVKKYGRQKLVKFLMKRKTASYSVWATENHRWLLSNGEVTEDLTSGDRLIKAPNLAAQFDYENATPEEKLYWAYGYVFGDGTITTDGTGKHRYSMVRLCKKDAIDYRSRFEELGFKTSTSHSLKGDFMAYTGTYFKTVPDPTIDSVNLIQAWVHGYLAADGEIDANWNIPGTTRRYKGIQCSNPIGINAIRQLFPIAGYYIVSEAELTGQETNFGIRPFTIKFRLASALGANNLFLVEKTTETREDEVWCLEVEDDQSFVMPSGIVTGNCATSYCDRPRFFAETLYMLLCGVGVGFSVQRHHIDQLPDLYTHRPVGVSYKIEDSIEGWAEALDALCRHFFYGANRPEFDYSEIRPRGAQLSTGGKAPGPEPLKNALEKIEAIFLRAIKRGDQRLCSIDAYDIVMHASDAVLSGGVRRSATICIFSPDDQEMMNAKTGNWFIDNPQRARSNNSALLLRSDNNKEKFLELIEATKQFGEPGFIFTDSLEYLFNPCVESSQCPVLISKLVHNRLFPSQIVQNYTLDLLDFSKRKYWESQGYIFQSGWQVCNLVETNASVWKTREDALRAVRLATVLGTIQGTYTNVGYLNSVSKEIIEREVLVGVSMTGMMDSPELAFNPELLQEMAQVVVETNKRWAEFLEINQSARLTLVKPAGNSTVNLSVDHPVASGAHPHHAKRFIRRVQIHKDDPVGQWFGKFNPGLVEESVWSSNKTDNVISFPLEIKPGAITKDEVSAIKFLEMVKLVQQNWVLPGTARPDSCEGNVNNVSCTCHVKQNEWDDVAEYIWDNRAFFSGLSLLGESGDFVYQQAPMQRVYFQAELEEKFGSANVGAAKHFKRHLERRYGDLYKVMMPLRMILLGYPSEESVKGTQVHPELLWESYLKLRSMLHIEDIDSILLLISAVGHEELWNSMIQNLTEVDYSQLVEFEDGTAAIDTVACAGPNGCEVSFVTKS